MVNYEWYCNNFNFAVFFFEICLWVQEEKRVAFQSHLN